MEEEWERGKEELDRMEQKRKEKERRRRNGQKK